MDWGFSCGRHDGMQGISASKFGIECAEREKERK